MKDLFGKVLFVRIRYLFGLAVMALACIGFVVAYLKNQESAAATPLADLLAAPQGEMKVVSDFGARFAAETSYPKAAFLKGGLRRRSERIERLTAGVETQGRDLPDGLRAGLTAQVLPALDPLGAVREFRTMLNDVAAADARRPAWRAAPPQALQGRDGAGLRGYRPEAEAAPRQGLGRDQIAHPGVRGGQRRRGRRPWPPDLRSDGACYRAHLPRTRRPAPPGRDGGPRQVGIPRQYEP